MRILLLIVALLTVWVCINVSTGCDVWENTRCLLPAFMED